MRPYFFHISVLDALTEDHFARYFTIQALPTLLSGNALIQRMSEAGQEHVARIVATGKQTLLLVLNEQGKVLAANSLIEALSGYVQWRAQDRVLLKDRAADQLLRDAIAAIDMAGGPSGRSFPVRDPGAGGGMLNSVGLQGPGVEYWIEHELPKLRALGTRVFASLWGRTVDDFAVAAKMLEPAVAALHHRHLVATSIKARTCPRRALPWSC